MASAKPEMLAENDRWIFGLDHSRYLARHFGALPLSLKCHVFNF